MRRFGYTFCFSLAVFIWLLPVAGWSYSSANYEIEEYVIDAGGSKEDDPDSSSPIDYDYLHTSVGQPRGAVNNSANYELLDGYLYYDDDPPLFPDEGSTNPDFMYWIQNLNPNSATFHIHTMEDTVPDPATYKQRSGANLYNVYYKGSPDGTNGSWGFSDSSGAWHILDDGLANPKEWTAADPAGSGWKRIDHIALSLGDCAAGTYTYTNTNTTDSCITNIMNNADNISYASLVEAPNAAEVIRTTIDFTNHPFDPGVPGDEERKTRISVDSVMVFKIVDRAGNVAFSAEISSTPWLMTDLADVHSNKKIFMFNVAPEPNVAYLVSAADSIVNMQSERDWEIPNYPAYLVKLEWPNLDYDLLIQKATDGGEIDDGELDGGVLGDTRTNLDYFLDTSDNSFENQTVYYKDGNLTIGNSGGYEGVTEGGAATIIVDGALNVVDDFVLNNPGYLAFLVRGNINISGNVNQIRGTYVADFEDGTYLGGIIDTGDDSVSPTQLVVVGQLIARGGFVFNRVYVGSFAENAPAEVIIYDPQIVLNTPPGLREIPSLGAWEEVIPE